jgi:phosphate transport system protein
MIGSVREWHRALEMNAEKKTEFEQNLRELNLMIARLGGLAEAQFARSVEALERRDKSDIHLIIDNDRQLDLLEFDINEKAVELISRTGPKERDLRRVIVALKIASILERVGDYAKNMAKRSLVIIDHEQQKSDNISLARMAGIVQQMLNRVLDAYASADAVMAMEVWERDMEVDQLHTSLFFEIMSGISDNPAQVSASSHMLFIAKNIERIGDYATGIAEQIYFLQYGVLPSDDRPKADNSSMRALA